MEILTFEELENDNGNVEFEGAGHGGAGVSFFVMNAERGRGPSLHTHDYHEVLITLEGRATLHTSEGDIEVGPGHVTVVPPGEPHGFTSSGDVPLRQVNIHVSPRMISRWLDQDSER